MPTGVYLQSAILINANDSALNISPNLQTYAFDYSLAGKLVPDAVYSTAATKPVITISYTTNTGKIALGYADIFYNRIWLIPTSVNLDGVPQLYTTTVSVWNSYFSTKSLSSVTGTNLTGINITGQTAVTYNPLEIKSYAISLTSSVPAIVNGYYTFTFSDAEDPQLPVKGTLALAFPYRHNWNSDWVETYTLKSGILESHNGTEQTYKLTANTRRTFNMEVLLADKAGIPETNLLRSKFYNSMAYGKYKSWIVPVWSDIRVNTVNLPIGTTSINIDTTNSDFKVNGYVYLYKDHNNYELITIQSLTTSSITLSSATQKAWDAGCYIVPAVQAKIQDDSLKGSIINYGVENFNLLWTVATKENETTNKIGTFSSDTYEGRILFLWKHNFTEDPSVEIYSPNRLVDFEVGSFLIDPRYNFTRVRSTYNYLLKDKAEISQALGFFKAVNGKHKPFWIPTYANEIQIVGTGVSSSNLISIKNIGYSDFIKQNPNQRDIILFKPDNTYIIRRITDSLVNIDGTETLTLNQPVGFNWTQTTFKEGHFLKLARLDQDSLEVAYLTNSAASISFVIVDSIQA